MLAVTFFSSASYAQEFGFEFSKGQENESVGINNQLVTAEVQQRFRENRGLNSSLKHIDEVLKNGVLDNDYGVPLTKDELNELEFRREIADTYAPIIIKELRGTKEFSEIGTFYLDNKSKGQLVVTFTDKAPNHIANRIASQVPESISHMFKFKEGKYSEKELADLAVEIATERKDEIEKMGVQLTMTESDDINNRVNVGITPLNLEVEKYLASKYGEDIIHLVEVEKGIEENRRAPQQFIFGGLRIGGTSAISNGSTGGCTNGFSLTTTNTIVTASHCLTNYSSYYQGGELIGSRGWRSSSGPDVGLINLNSSKNGTTRIYRNSAGDRTMTSWQRNFEDYVGMDVAKSGDNTGVTGGLILSRSVSYSSSPWSGLRSASYGSGGGDSGSPTYWGGKYFGVHSGRVSGNAVYTHIHNAINAINSNNSGTRYPRVAE